MGSKGEGQRKFAVVGRDGGRSSRLKGWLRWCLEWRRDRNLRCHWNSVRLVVGLSVRGRTCEIGLGARLSPGSCARHQRDNTADARKDMDTAECGSSNIGRTGGTSTSAASRVTTFVGVC